MPTHSIFGRAKGILDDGPFPITDEIAGDHATNGRSRTNVRVTLLQLLTTTTTSPALLVPDGRWST